MSDDENNNVDFHLLISQVPNPIRNRIFNPPRAEADQDKNLIHIIRQMHKLDFADETISLILSQYPISKGKNLDELIKKSKSGNPSERSLSLEFAEEFKNKLNYCPRWDKWFFWEGNYWKEDDKNLYIEHICQVLDRAEMPDFRRRAATVKGVEFIIKGNPELTSSTDDWDRNPWLLATPNGTTDLRKGTRRISYPEDRITKITSVAPKKITITKWLRFLLQATHKNKEYIRYLQRVCGYCLTGNTSEHAVFFLYGAGGNGKGVFLNTIISILKDYAVTAPFNFVTEMKNEQHSTNVAMMRGARLVTAQEVQDGKAWDEIKVKSLSGGDPITAHFMHQDNFTFIPNFKLLIAGNHEPQLRNVDDATTRRFNKLPFTHKPRKINRHLFEDLIPEHSGILQWMINGCLEWQKQGLNPPKVVVDTTKEYFSNQNSFQQFLEDKCYVKLNDKSVNCPSSELFKVWCFYASANHIRQGTMAGFRENLEKHGITYHKNLPNQHGVRGFIGIKLKIESSNTPPRQLVLPT